MWSTLSLLAKALGIYWPDLYETFVIKAMDEDYEQVCAPKIKYREFACKIILDPADFRKGLPKSHLPQLCENGIILSLQNKKCGVARLTGDGSLKLNVLFLVGRFAEVEVIDDCCPDFWIGRLFGFTVKGTGGQGRFRDCVILKIQSNSHLTAEARTVRGGKQFWYKIVKKVNYQYPGQR